MPRSGGTTRKKQAAGREETERLSARKVDATHSVGVLDERTKKLTEKLASFLLDLSRVCQAPP